MEQCKDLYIVSIQFKVVYTLNQQRYDQGKEWLMQHENSLCCLQVAYLIDIFVESMWEVLPC